MRIAIPRALARISPTVRRETTGDTASQENDSHCFCSCFAARRAAAAGAVAARERGRARAYNSPGGPSLGSSANVAAVCPMLHSSSARFAAASSDGDITAWA